MEYLKTTNERLSSVTCSYWEKSSAQKLCEKPSSSSTHRLKLHSQKQVLQLDKSTQLLPNSILKGQGERKSHRSECAENINTYTNWGIKEKSNKSTLQKHLNLHFAPPEVLCTPRFGTAQVSKKTPHFFFKQNNFFSLILEEKQANSVPHL